MRLDQALVRQSSRRQTPDPSSTGSDTSGQLPKMGQRTGEQEEKVGSIYGRPSGDTDGDVLPGEKVIVMLGE